MLLQRVANRGIALGTLFDRAAARHPGNEIILDHDLDVAPELGRRLPVGVVADLVADLASRLSAAGVRPGDHVVVHKSNSFDITLLACALIRIGAVPALLSPMLDGATVAELIRRMDRPFLLTDQAKIDTALPDTVFDTTAGVLLAAGDDPRAVALPAMTGVARVPAVTAPVGHPVLITHTSGTTGLPKLAVHTGFTLQARYRPQASVAALVRCRRPVAIHVSFVHSRLYTALAITLLRGFPLLVLADDDPEQAAELFLTHRPGVLEAHPNTFIRWERLAADPRRPLAPVRYFSSTFDAIHPRTVRRMLGASEHRFPVFGQLYGQSEVGPVVARAFTRHRRADADGRCVGMPFPGMTGLRVVSRDGRAPSVRSPGFIEVRTDGRVLTYLGESRRYDAQRDGSWWRMGDVGYRTRWGCLHLLDREVDEISGFGSTLAVEDALFSRIDDLAEVIIVPGPDGTAVPVICTEDDRPLDRDRWRRATATLPPMAEPVQWKHADLPQTATTKIKRLELARLLGPGHEPG
ncbi:class I adenylate-forming enzyme family protein [Actinoplanes sp. NPDC051494]|uniref:class I adenylate-forming enzyme family protein n=1 Tax=Actinoplanes sp. NPDC051494 TaxID=3363907 RepID=UPI0037B77A41